MQKLADLLLCLLGFGRRALGSGTLFHGRLGSWSSATASALLCANAGLRGEWPASAQVQGERAIGKRGKPCALIFTTSRGIGCMRWPGPGFQTQGVGSPEGHMLQFALRAINRQDWGGRRATHFSIAALPAAWDLSWLSCSDVGY